MGVLGQSVGNKHTELADGIFLRDSQGKKKKSLSVFAILLMGPTREW